MQYYLIRGRLHIHIQYIYMYIYYIDFYILLYIIYLSVDSLNIFIAKYLIYQFVIIVVIYLCLSLDLNWHYCWNCIIEYLVIVVYNYKKFICLILKHIRVANPWLFRLHRGQVCFVHWAVVKEHQLCVKLLLG